MENASKALIIAGAILLAIIIISLGLMVVNNARSQIGGANLDKQTMEAFNSEWDIYAGSKKSASDVKSLCSKAITNNATEKSLGTAKYVKISGKGIDISEDGSTTKTTIPALSNAQTYTITISKYKNGIVSEITVAD